MTASQAHGVSLHLFTLLEGANSKEPGVGSAQLNSAIEALGMNNHLVVVVVVQRETVILSFEPKTSYGSEVLGELKARSQFPPCPDGECEPHNGICKWCGRVTG